MRSIGTIFILIFSLTHVDAVRKDGYLAMSFKGNQPFLNGACPFYKSEGTFTDEAPSSSNLLQDFLCYVYSEVLVEGEGYLNSFEEVGKTLAEVCHIVPSNLDSKSRQYERCSVCHVFVRQMRNALRNPVKQFVMIRIFRGACEIFAHYFSPLSVRRRSARECKRIVSEYGPVIFSTLRRSLKVVDLCHKMRICDGLCIMEA